MSQKTTPPEVKTLGRSPKSLTAPLAAFAMALVLGSYCITSIREARRDARYHNSNHDEGHKGATSEPQWLSKAVEESKGK